MITAIDLIAQRKGIGNHGAVKYKVIYWDDNQKLRQKIKDELNKQLNNL